jgi:TonB family protein
VVDESHVAPGYPKQALKKKVHGVVTLSAVIGTDGRLKDVNVLAGNPLLADAAKSAVLNWRYNPALRNGVPVEEPTTINITFNERGGISTRDNEHAALSSAYDHVPEPPTGVILFRPGTGITPPVLTYGPDPTYTPRARKAREQGTVRLWFVVTVEGTTRDIQVEKSDPKLGPDLIQNAIDALRSWKFTPAMKDGRPLAVQIGASVGFQLEKSQ